jgi:hypothetical protein
LTSLNRETVDGRDFLGGVGRSGHYKWNSRPFRAQKGRYNSTATDLTRPCSSHMLGMSTDALTFEQWG